MLSAFLSAFAIIFIAELPDKTALASLSLATKYRFRDVITGVFLAFFVQTVIAVSAGSLLTLLPAKPIHVAAGVGFLIFAILALRGGKENEGAKLAKEEAHLTRTRLVSTFPWLASFVVVFLAEWGDLSQIATATLVARTGEPIAVGIGALLGLWSVSAIAIRLGSQATKLYGAARLRFVSAGLFAIVGAVMIVTTLL